MTTQRPERLARFSVLDTSPIVSGSTAREALERTLDLARCADVLGCERFWVAEHHGMKGVASAALRATGGTSGVAEIGGAGGGVEYA